MKSIVIRPKKCQLRGKKERTESDFSEKILTKAKLIIGKSFRIEPVKVFKGTRGNNNQGGKTEIIRHFLVLKKNLQDQILHKTVLDI